MFLAISEAVAKGKLTESTVREAVKPLFYTRMRLGLFDPPELNPFAQLNASIIVQNEGHRQLSLDTAMRTFVLLKNTDNFLPLKHGFQYGKVAVGLHGNAMLSAITFKQSGSYVNRLVWFFSCKRFFACVLFYSINVRQFTFDLMDT
jgi:beta-glucosidase-like glycosyl hydrolase